MATGQKKGKMITLWLLRVVVGLVMTALGCSRGLPTNGLTGCYVPESCNGRLSAARFNFPA